MPELQLQEHFDSMERQQQAARFGMWVFLSSETLLFAGLFALYAAYRAVWPEGFLEGIAENDIWLGSLNTLVLITSSFTVALSVHALRHAQPRRAVALVAATIALGVAFLLIKLTEYGEHIGHGILPGRGPGIPEEPAGMQAFFTIYYATTGLHALHVMVGLGVLVFMAVAVLRGRLTARTAHPLEVGALYWHLVDVIWIFLWPLFYLTGA